MGGFTFSLNLNSLNTAISNLDKSAAQIQSANNAGLETVAQYLRDTLVKYSQAGHPDHPNVQSGNLSGHMTYVMGNGQAIVGSQTPYAPYVEFGHMSRSWGSNRWHFVPAYPFFRPAIQEVFYSGLATSLFKAAVKGLMR